MKNKKIVFAILCSLFVILAVIRCTSKTVPVMIGYNLYLKAGIGPGVFKFENELNQEFIYGKQTNCLFYTAMG